MNAAIRAIKSDETVLIKKSQFKRARIKQFLRKTSATYIHTSLKFASLHEIVKVKGPFGVLRANFHPDPLTRGFLAQKKMIGDERPTWKDSRTGRQDQFVLIIAGARTRWCGNRKGIFTFSLHLRSDAFESCGAWSWILSAEILFYKGRESQRSTSCAFCGYDGWWKRCVGMKTDF